MRIEALKLFALAGLLLTGGALLLQAQSNSLEWQAISGGGGTSSNGSLTLTGTIGQWGAGVLSGGNLTVKGGFLSHATDSPSSGLLVSSANPALPGTDVTFAMTIGAVTPGTGTPTGTVNFRIDGAIAGSGTLSSGVAAFSTSTLTHALHTVVAEYAGDANFVGTTNSLVPDQKINTPPVAGNVNLYRNPLSGTKVLLTTLLANDRDADGDTLTLTVSAASANNAPIAVRGGWVFYTPPAGFTNADSFTYTVNDGNGGTSTATVAVALQVDTNQSQNLVVTALGNNEYLINGNGVAGYTYRLQHSGLGMPFTWQSFAGSFTTDSTGKFAYTDTSSGQTQFYRTVYP